MLLVSGVAFFNLNFFFFLVNDLNNVSQFITMSLCLSGIYKNRRKKRFLYYYYDDFCT